MKDDLNKFFRVPCERKTTKRFLLPEAVFPTPSTSHTLNPCVFLDISSIKIYPNYSDLTRPHPKGSLVGEISLFQVFPGWWIIIICPESRWLAERDRTFGRFLAISRWTWAFYRVPVAPNVFHGSLVLSLGDVRNWVLWQQYQYVLKGAPLWVISGDTTQCKWPKING